MNCNIKFINRNKKNNNNVLKNFLSFYILGKMRIISYKLSDVNFLDSYSLGIFQLVGYVKKRKQKYYFSRKSKQVIFIHRSK